MNSIAIIPARGGSKGVPMKNLKFILGKPLIAHTIQNALQARLVTRVIVSTDCTDIGRVAQEYGAEVIWRPAELSGDTASSESALLHALEYLEKTENYKPDLTVFLQCTSPLTLPEDIDGTIQLLLDEDADSAFTAVPFHRFLWKKDTEGGGSAINHDKRKRPLRQERELQFLENGSVYVMRADGFRKEKHRFFGKISIYEVPEVRSLEIDEPLDFKIIEYLVQESASREKMAPLPADLTAVVFDFDGVFTDNKVFVFQDGREALICDRADGLGLSEFKKLKIPMLVLSGEKNPVVKARCNKLGLDLIYGVDEKLAPMTTWLSSKGISDMSGVVYVGNDLNDLACLNAAACGIVVQDAHVSVKATANIILSSNGGGGAVREVVDLISKRVKINNEKND